jgi:hypothetical protein
MKGFPVLVYGQQLNTVHLCLGYIPTIKESDLKVAQYDYTKYK